MSDAKTRASLPAGCIRVGDYDTITKAAKVAGVSRTTLRDAVHRGDDIESVKTPGGLVLVKISSAFRWAAAKRRIGRPDRVAASGLFN